MWKTIVNYIPEWTAFVQAFIVFIVPYGIYKVFEWIQREEEGEV
ncbi:hypothetical protein [Priestia endophytica]|jgi:hypothetical protein|uniref:Spore germination protein n=1 Tax=Priestia endophytica DSM 13796 TaxID=1121089 RepID=A0A1I5YZ91_9BACI|nr:hypothetical protein [Priestia endophytica]SFQ49532.1 spore germination protein [Priestia endophytica DSM 13796]